MGDVQRERPLEQRIEKWRHGQGRGIEIATGACFQAGFGVSESWIREPGKVPWTQACVLGEDRVLDKPPSFVLEGSVLHALLIAGRKAEESPERLDHIELQAGNWRTSRALATWFGEGELHLESGAKA